VGHFEFALDKLLEDAETVEAGHLDVEEDEVGIVFLDEVDGVKAILSLGEEIDFGKAFQEEREFVAGGLFVVHDDCVDRHGGNKLSIAWAYNQWRAVRGEWREMRVERRKSARVCEADGRNRVK
jgi:hypothetical protein